jgi:hypothetical protein
MIPFSRWVNRQRGKSKIYPSFIFLQEPVPEMSGILAWSLGLCLVRKLYCPLSLFGDFWKHLKPTFLFSGEEHFALCPSLLLAIQPRVLLSPAHSDYIYM